MDGITSDPWWNEHFEPAESGQEFDYLSRDRSTAVVVIRSPQGSRGLYAGSVRLALAAASREKLKRACLVIDATRLSARWLRGEWESVRQLFSPGISRRLAIVAVGAKEPWFEPHEPIMDQIAAAWARNDISESGGLSSKIRPYPRRRSFEVVKVLLVRWLRSDGPIPLGKLADAVGCTYPTIRRAIRQLEIKSYLSRESNRSVQLARFPQESWKELLALAPSMRGSLQFTDRSGDEPSPHRLLERLNRIRPPGIAVGGVSAARYWHPDFDLHGMPRLDLVLHAPDGTMDIRFLKRLDPALEQAAVPNSAPALVIHPLIRKDSLFTESKRGPMPLADPVETLLDLHELGLSRQADQMLAHFRRQARRP